MSKIVKFKQGDILYHKLSECKVILLNRWDRKSFQRTAWLAKAYPDGVKEFAVPEDELFLEKP